MRLLFSVLFVPSVLFSADFARVLQMPDVAEKMTSQGQTPFHQKPDQFAALMKEDYSEYGRIIKAANIKIDQ